MTLASLAAHYGLIIVFLGAGIEGETIVIGAGLLAHEGLLNPWGVMIAAWGGSAAADQALFFLGRLFRTHPRIVALTSRPAVQSVLRLLQARPAAFIFGFRFLYGLRTISPIAIGTAQVPAWRFVAVNVVAASAWAMLFTALGYVFGSGVQRLLGHVPWFAKILALALFAGALLLLLRWLRRRCERPAHARDAHAAAPG